MSKPNADSEPIAPEIVDQAVTWFVKLSSGAATHEEQAACAQWRAAAPAHERAWQRLEGIAHTAQHGSRATPLARGTLIDVADRQLSRRQVLKKSILLLGLVGGSVWLARQSIPWTFYLADIRTGAAGRRELTLAELLAGSGLSYRFIDAQTVTLEPARTNQIGQVTLDPIGVVGARLTDPVIGDQTSFSVIGERSIIDTPFSVTGFTDDLIENTNARSATDVVLRDPSVSQEVNGAGFQDGLSIRGFSVDFGSVLYDGVPGLHRRDGYFNVVNLQRIEVFRGANAFNSGIGIFGGVGGTINLVPKRPAGEPINKLTLGYEEEGSPFFAVDFSRRFGANEQFGLRFNGFSQDEAGKVGKFDRQTGTYALYLDWQPTDRLTLGAEVTRFVDRSDGYRDDIFLEARVPIPDVPDDLTLNYSQLWAFIQDSGYRYYANVHWEFIDNWSLSAGGGMVDGDDDNGFYSAFGRVQDEEGTLTQFPFRRFRTKTESYVR